MCSLGLFLLLIKAKEKFSGPLIFFKGRVLKLFYVKLSGILLNKGWTYDRQSMFLE